MISSNFGIAQQIGDFGVFGKVDISFEITGLKKVVNISIPQEFERWNSGVYFGTTYWIEHNLESVGINLWVKDIDFNEVDTNNIVIAYLMFKSLKETAQIPNKGEIIFDDQKKAFVFLNK